MNTYLDSYSDIQIFFRIRIIKWIPYADTKYGCNTISIGRILDNPKKNRIYPVGYYPNSLGQPAHTQAAGALFVRKKRGKEEK